VSVRSVRGRKEGLMAGPAYEIATVHDPVHMTFEVWFDKRVYAMATGPNDAERIVDEIKAVVKAGKDPNDPLERVRILGPAGEAFPDPEPRAPVNPGKPRTMEISVDLLAQIAAEQGKLSGELAAVFVRLTALEQGRVAGS
jgi:hypothetical protein